MQLALLEKHGEFLNRKLNMVDEKIVRLGEDTDWLNEEFVVYTNRPGEVREEVLAEVDERIQNLEQDQVEFERDLAANFDRYQHNYNTRLTSVLDSMQVALDYRETFVQFVFTEQDSINREFAGRFDARPWYHSVLSTWAESEKQQ
jgi:hypothetical protein